MHFNNLNELKCNSKWRIDHIVIEEIVVFGTVAQLGNYVCLLLKVLWGNFIISYRECLKVYKTGFCFHSQQKELCQEHVSLRLGKVTKPLASTLSLFFFFFSFLSTSAIVSVI